MRIDALPLVPVDRRQQPLILTLSIRFHNHVTTALSGLPSACQPERSFEPTFAPMTAAGTLRSLVS